MELETQGLHPATELCLTALQWVEEQSEFTNVLDMGCGGGILTVLCATLWDARVLGADIAEKAVEEANAAIAAQGLQGQAQAIRSDGFANRQIAARGPYDLILFNLLAEPIIAWAREVKTHSQPGGYVFLGGILHWQKEDVIAAYNALGFEVAHEFTSTPWHGFMLCHKTDI